MKVFMLGWEFPPYISGGLGTACYGITKALDQLGVHIAFVMPRADVIHFSRSPASSMAKGESLEALQQGFQHVHFCPIPIALHPYAPHDPKRCTTAVSLDPQVDMFCHTINRHPGGGENQDENYGRNILLQVTQYAAHVLRVAQTESFDLIHAHDWMTFPAAISLHKRFAQPLVVHVHSTEFDRSGEHVNQKVYDIERLGMHTADQVITVSNYTKHIIVGRYGVPAEKVTVVYNAVEQEEIPDADSLAEPFRKTDRVVLFLGRITMQKGPEYFLAAARKVLDVFDKVKFIVAGDGDMMYRIVELAAQMGIGDKVRFAGFLHGDEVRRAFQMADLYVMPSVSEPFGIAALEAMREGIPVIISKQSGAAEILAHALKVDFWDIDEMANKMLAVLTRPALHQSLSANGHRESIGMRWENAAVRIKAVYEGLCCPV